MARRCRRLVAPLSWRTCRPLEGQTGGQSDEQDELCARSASQTTLRTGCARRYRVIPIDALATRSCDPYRRWSHDRVANTAELWGGGAKARQRQPCRRARQHPLLPRRLLPLTLPRRPSGGDAGVLNPLHRLTSRARRAVMAELRERNAPLTTDNPPRFSRWGGNNAAGHRSFRGGGRGVLGWVPPSALAL